MTKEQFIQRATPYMERCISARRVHCPKTADARLRDIARLLAQFKGMDYDKAHSTVCDLEKYNSLYRLMQM